MLWRSHQHLTSNNADHALISLTKGGAGGTSEQSTVLEELDHPLQYLPTPAPASSWQTIRWTLLGRARLALVPLLTRIYLLSQKQTCQRSKQRTGKSKAIYLFFVFRRCHIQYGDLGTSSKFATQRHPVGCFEQSSSHVSICWVPSPHCEPSW